MIARRLRHLLRTVGMGVIGAPLTLGCAASDTPSPQIPPRPADVSSIVFDPPALRAAKQRRNVGPSVGLPEYARRDAALGARTRDHRIR